MSVDGDDFHSTVGEALGILIEGLSPFVEQVFSGVLPSGSEWVDILRKKDSATGRRTDKYRSRDLSLMLRAMTERLGDLGYPFSGRLSRQAQACASELREVRNRWAHNEAFTAQEAYRAIDSAELLLRSIGRNSEADRIALLKPPPTVPAAGTRSLPPSEVAPRSQSASPGAGGGPRIEIHAVPDLSYAMAHCRIPVIDHITVENTGADVRGAKVEVDVVSADGSHGGPREVFVDLSAEKPTILRTVDLQLDPASMLSVEDQRPGAIRVVLRTAAGERLAEATQEVNILAANQWKATPLQLAMEMLAAHVQPNSPAIAELMTDVSDRLHALTGNSAIDGYQSENPERVDAIAEAVFDAMRARDIRYAEPPASWGTDGQKVRTPADVLEGRLGTCLDTTLTMAAALEQAGINSTIWVLNGHAFLGYWRTDSALSMVSSTEVLDVVNQVDLGNIRLVETTMVTQADNGPTFADATTAPRVRHLSGDLSNILGVTDVRQARQAQIHPLPSRTVDADGTVVVTHYRPGAGPTIAPYVAGEKERREATVEDVPPRITQWKNALLDLSLRNKLINYTERAGYRIEVPGPALARLEDAVNASTPISLLASDAVKSVDAARGIRYGRDLPESERELLLAEKRLAYIDITEASYKGKLRYLAYKAKTIVEETSANNLYLAFGMLNWRFNDRDLRSPLVLVPVTLSTTNRGERYVITIDEAGISTPNYCLIEKLRMAFGLEIPELANPVEDESGIDLEEAFNGVRRAVARAELPFRVEDSVHLSILHFAKFPLWKDLDESWRELSQNSLVKHLIETPVEPYVDPVSEPPQVDLDELGSSVPVPADSSQLTAVAEAVAGRTFVLEGPPGTGKSQTITNLLAHAMASGRRVLFVAEKRAALDVVKKRLEEVGLGALSLDLHDKSARPAAVRAQIKAALDLRISHDAELLKTSTHAAESSRRTLARYAERLHEPNAANKSLYTARSSELATDPDVPTLDVPRDLVANGPQETLDKIAAVLRTLPEKADLARPSASHPWGFIDDLPADGLDPRAIHEAAVEFDQALQQIARTPVDFDSVARTVDPVDLDIWATLAPMPRYPLEALDQLHRAGWTRDTNGIAALLQELAQSQPEWKATAGPTAMDLDIPAIHHDAQAADESGFFGRKKRRRAVLARLTEVLTVDPASIKLKTLSRLTADMAESFAAVEDLRSRVTALPVRLVDEPVNPFIPEQVERLDTRLGQLKWLVQTLCTDPDQEPVRVMRRYYASTEAGVGAGELRRLTTAWRHLEKVTAVPLERQHAWAGEDSFITRWCATRSARRVESSASIERWVDLLEHLEPLRAAGMGQARRALLTGEVSAEDASLAFDRGIAVASIDERLEASALMDFDLNAHTKTIQRFVKSTKAVRDELRRAIPAKLLNERRFDANTSSGQIGALRRQLDRRRGGMGVRALIENFGELITQILPCTLMSPDSVARFFPAKSGYFDIVVFDEASQIRVADAVGAMGRAKSVVVVGDSKQMPPTSFAEVSVTVDEDEDYSPDVVIDEESILSECVQARVPRQWLSWHYRSQDEALIAFSNYHYYDGRLASFPAPLPAKGSPGAGYGLSLVRVDGHFERSRRGKTLRTNRVEAERIVEDILYRFSASPDRAPSLGVITFNAQQRDLIENLLRDAGDDRVLRALDEPDGLFVKNLENVQGDERDSILFSVAFSANDKGVVPLNFGPLSRPGGERRLNVAVTRARREVVLYASFDPSDLRAEETSQVGTKHLKAYLEMAAQGVDTVTEGGRRQPVIDRHRDDIANALREAGLPVSTDVGLSDFRVDIVISDPEQPDQPLVAVLLDGTEWFGRRTVADRDGLPVDVLERLMKWPAVERVWLPEWLDHRTETINRLRDAVDEAKRELARREVVPDPESEQLVSPPTQVLKTDTSTAAVVADGKRRQYAALKSAPAASVSTQQREPKRHPMIQPFREFVPRRAGDVETLDRSREGWASTRIKAVIAEVIDAEGPIHQDRLARLVAKAFGLSRVNDDRRRSIQRLVPAEYRRKTGEKFYWPKDIDPAAWRVVRQPEGGASRPLEEISLIEIGNAMLVVAEQSGGIGSDELLREALNLLGGKRITQSIRSRLDAALSKAVERGLLRESESGLIHRA